MIPACPLVLLSCTCYAHQFHLSPALDNKRGILSCLDNETGGEGAEQGEEQWVEMTHRQLLCLCLLSSNKLLFVGKMVWLWQKGLNFTMVAKWLLQVRLCNDTNNTLITLKKKGSSPKWAWYLTPKTCRNKTVFFSYVRESIKKNVKINILDLNQGTDHL